MSIQNIYTISCILSQFGEVSSDSKSFFLDKTYLGINKLEESLASKIETIFDDLNHTTDQGTVEAQKMYLKKVIKTEINDLKKELVSKVHQKSFGSIKSKNEKENEKSIKHALSLLNKLDKGLEIVELEGMAISIFEDKSPFKGRLNETFKLFIPEFIVKLIDKVRRNIFRLWNVEGKRDHLVKVLPELQKKRVELQDKIKDLKYDPNTSTHYVALSQKKGRFLNQLKDGFSLPDAKIVWLNAKLMIMTAEMDVIQKKGDMIVAVKKEALEKKLDDIEAKILSAEKSIKKIEDGIAAGIKIRTNLQIISGEPLAIIDEATHSELDGMYLSADSFRETVKNLGGKIASYQLDSFVANGFVFPADTFNESKVSKALEELGLEEAGWIYSTNVEDNTIAIFSEDDKNKLNALVGKGANFDYIEKEIDLNQKSEGGTIILTSGSGGVYEMHKKEILAFLMRGMNVMTFNFAGYGQSKGVPNETTVKKNMEAAYEHLQLHHPVPDEKILIKALCITGGPATYLAAKHPKTNLLLDQSYADFRDIVGDQVKFVMDDFIKHVLGEKEKSSDLSGDSKEIKNQLRKWIDQQIDNLAHMIAKIIAPAWETSKEIRKVDGHVGILLTTNDELMKLDRDVYNNYKAMAKAGKLNQVTVMSIEGEHGTNWLYAMRKAGFISDEDKLISLLNEEYREEFQYYLNKEETIPFVAGVENFLEEIAKQHLHLDDQSDRSLIESLMEQMVDKWFQDNKELGTKFFKDAFPDAPSIEVGKIQMDKFLEKDPNKLRGNLFV